MTKKKKKTVDLSKLSDDELREFLYREVVRKALFKKPPGMKVCGFSDPETLRRVGEIIHDETVKLAQRVGEAMTIAQQQGETTTCPQCGYLVPRTKLTVLQKKNGSIVRFCTICETEFQGR